MSVSKATYVTEEYVVSYKWSGKSAYDLLKRHKRADEIGVGRIRTFPFSSDSAHDSVAYDPVKTRLSESQAEAGGTN